MINNYLKVVDTEANKIVHTFFFDDSDEDSICRALGSAASASAVARASHLITHLAMWRMPNICAEMLTEMRYTTRCPAGRHRFEADKTGEVDLTQCAACGGKPNQTARSRR